MDRGIATKDNIKYLREKGYQYIIAKREDESPLYEELFRTERETFTCISGRRKSVYGDENNVYVKKIETDDKDICKVLCISDGKAQKEKAIDGKKQQRFLDDIEKFDKSIKKGTIKKVDKINAKLERIINSHRQIAAYYDLSVSIDESCKATGIAISKRPDIEETLYGCYVLETTHTELEDTAVWELYMTLSRVENAFRAMKSQLGMRPVYHQLAHRTEAHLFITVLAYHVLMTIENLLGQKGDHRQFSTLREVLSTHTRSTVIMKDKDGNVYHTRVSGKPEDIHQDIYDKLDVKDTLKCVTSLVKTVCSDRKKL